MSTAIVRQDTISSLDDVQRVARLLAVSNYFDAKGNGDTAIAQLATKILAGREMGYGPFASVQGIHVIQGRPALSANLMAAAVKGSGRYDYRVRQMTADVCEIEFFENVGGKRESLGLSTFTAQDARAAGTQNMAKFARNMLFARAMSNGVKWFCPDVFNGSAVYVPEELGAEVDGDGNVITVQAHVVEEAPRNSTPPTANGTATGNANSNGGSAGNGHNGNGRTPRWDSPAAAYAWAVESGACANEFEAKNSFKKIVDANGGRLTKENMADVMEAFRARQMEKLHELADAAAEDAPEMNPEDDEVFA